MINSVRRFMSSEFADGVVLLAATITALLWANVISASGYADFWGQKYAIGFGSHTINNDLRHWITDGLMTIFFLVVGIEIKREFVSGELSSIASGSLPIFAAIGGMALPAAIYFAINRSGDASKGWGIPMATDIVFAVGVLSIFRGLPTGLRAFLLALAIVDDIGSIVAIAVFYSTDIRSSALLTALGLSVLLLLMSKAGRLNWWLTVLFLLTIWLALYKGGVHPSIAGVIVGLMLPVDAEHGVHSLGEQFELWLQPISSFLVVPLFALANAGVVFRSGMFDGEGAERVAAGVIAGLVVGKLVGILGATFLVTRLRQVSLPVGTNWGQIAGVSALAGIGFTVSLFISDLAFSESHPEYEHAAAAAILIASVIAAILGMAILLSSGASFTEPELFEEGWAEE